MMKHHTNLKRNDHAISPVIGTILMVAATVIIAGAVYAAVNSYNGKSANPAPDAAFKAQTVDTDGDGLEDMIKVTYLSGPAGQNNVVVTVTSATTRAVLAAASPGSWDAGDYQSFDGCASTAASASPLVIGDCQPGGSLNNQTAAGSYFIIVSMGTSTVLDQTLALKE